MSDEQETTRGRRPGKNPGRPPGRKPLAEGSAEDTRTEIRRQAVRLFNVRGYDSVSLDDIARAASVNRATVYYHFASKEEVFLDSIQSVVSFVQGAIETIINQTHLSVRDRLASLVHTRREMQRQDLSVKDDAMDEHRIHDAMQHLSPQAQQRVGMMMGALHGLTHNLIAEGIANQEIVDLPPQVIDFAFWQLFPPDGYPAELGVDREEMERSLLRLFFDGVKR